MNLAFQNKFSVIIPTMDRGDYLAHTLRTCINQDYPNLEVIVSDDGSTDNTREVVEQAMKIDSRIRYVTPGKNVGMLDNFEFALDHVTGNYVIALGGDDAILPYGISGINHVLCKTGKEMLAWPTPAYFYPNVKMKTGQLILPFKTLSKSRAIRNVKSFDFLTNQYEKLNYLGDSESPMFYVKGVVSKRLIDKVKARTPGGRFYSCPTPDGYSGIVLAGEINSWAYTNKPFTMHGVSPTSQGNAYLSSDPKSHVQSARFFKHVENRPMHSKLAGQPYSPLISIMTADYLLTCGDLPGWEGLKKEIDYKKLLSYAINELSDGLFSHEKINRELNILYRIAELHSLGDFFIRKVSRKARNSRKVLEGSAMSPDRIYLHAEKFNIHNVFDASYAAFNLSEFSSSIDAKFGSDIISKSIRYKLMSYKRGESFPDASEWALK